MPDTYAPLTAYDLTTGVIVNMDEAIYMYSPEELPLLNGLGSDGLSVLSSSPVDQIEFSWLDEENLAPRSETAASVASTTADTVLKITPGDEWRFSTDDVLIIAKAGVSQPELMIVKAISATTSGDITVGRAYAGSITSYVTGAEVIGLGTALAEGSDPHEFRATDTTKRTNNTQIFGPTKIEMSGTAEVVPRYGIPNQWAHQLALRTYEASQAREQAFVYGRKTNNTSTKVRTMGGLVEFIATNVDTTSTELSVANIQTQQQACYDLGGLPTHLMSNPAKFIASGGLNDIGNTGRVRVEITDAKRGRVRCEQLLTEFGVLEIVRNRHIAKSDAIAWTRDNVKRRVMRPLTFEMLAKTGDAKKGQIVCEEGLQVKGERHMFRFANLS